MGRIKYSVFCTAIFSASDPLRSSRMRLWMSDCRFTQRDLNNRTGYTAVSSIHGWCHVKLLPFRRTFCVHHTTTHHLHCHFIRSHIRRVHVCSAVTCHFHVWHNVRCLLRTTAVTWRWNRYRSKSQHKYVDPREENCSAARTGTRTRDLSITNPALYRWAMPSSQ